LLKIYSTWSIVKGTIKKFCFINRRGTKFTLKLQSKCICIIYIYINIYVNILPLIPDGSVEQVNRKFASKLQIEIQDDYTCVRWIWHWRKCQGPRLIASLRNPITCVQCQVGHSPFLENIPLAKQDCDPTSLPSGDFFAGNNGESDSRANDRNLVVAPTSIGSSSRKIVKELENIVW
jgi:hypothetical protein